jgi:hypothetical protein
MDAAENGGSAEFATVQLERLFLEARWLPRNE